MNIRGAAAVTIAALGSLAGLTPALGASNDIVIGDIGNLSGVYTDTLSHYLIHMPAAEALPC